MSAPENVVRTVIRLPKSLHSQLANAAHHTQRSQNDIMIEAISRFLSQKPKDKENEGV